jgi:hypothetical protein
MDDGSKRATTMTEMDMTGDLIVMHEDVTTVNMQGPYTGVKVENTFVKEELPTNNNTHLYVGKYETYKVARCDVMHVDVDTKYVPTFEQSEAYKVACKKDVTIKTNLKEMKNVTDRKGTEMLAGNTYHQAMNETYQEEDVDKTYPDINIMRVCTNKPPGTATVVVKGLHTREKEEDHLAREEPPADNKVLAKYEYGGKPHMQDSIDVQDVPNVPPQEELPADNKVVAKYEYEEAGRHFIRGFLRVATKVRDF